MDSNENKKNSPDSRKVIDISDRISARLASKGPVEKLKAMKIRLDLEQAKIAIPASLLSILVVVTLANSKLLDSPEVVESRELASQGTVIAPSRGIASIPSGTSHGEDELIQTMSQKTLSEIMAVGRKPSALEKLSLETLEGKYAIRMDSAQKITELEIAQNQVDSGIVFDSKFMDENRSWMPVTFDKSLRVESHEGDIGQKQTFHLVNKLSIPVARVDVSLDTAGRLLAMKVVPTTASEK